MTATAPPTPTCSTCATTVRPDARFCVRCGSALASAPPHTAPRLPVPRPPSSTPTASPRARCVVPPGTPRRAGWSGSTAVLVALAAVLVLVCGAAVAVLVAGPHGSAAVGPAPAATSGPALAPPRTDPAQELQATRVADGGAVGALVGSWVPQLSTKKVGMVAEGRTWDAATILAEHRELRAAHTDARLVWSGDYPSFRGDDFWVTLVARPFAGAAAANAWCDRAGLDGDHCFAKRLARAGGPDGNSVMRSGAAGSAGGSSTSPSSGEVGPVVGDSGWAPGVVGYGTARPRELNANGDGTSYAEDITWQSWGGPTATGRGTASWVPPDGFVSDGSPAPVVVVASDLGPCNGHLAYRTVAWYFPTKGETAPEPGSGYDDICTPR